MLFKLVSALAILGIASAYVAPLTLISANQLAPLRVVHVQKDSLPQYTYNYGVHDSISGDSKTQTETRNGDKVRGEYSLIDADGYKRTVTYTADAEHGFQAVVDRKPIAHVPADIQASIDAHLGAPNTAPLVIKKPLNSNAISIIQPAAPAVLYAQGLIKSASLAAPLVVHSALIPFPRAGTYSVRSVFKPRENVKILRHPIANGVPYLRIY